MITKNFKRELKRLRNQWLAVNTAANKIPGMNWNESLTNFTEFLQGECNRLAETYSLAAAPGENDRDCGQPG